ncbi:MAG TPA: cation transporter [Abditibacteriaceae bacterium]
MTTNLKIDGMTCGMCVSHVTKALEAVHGVESVRVDLESGSAVVEHSGTDAAQLVEAVVEDGYEAQVSD